MTSLFVEFKKFINRGNVIDMAVGLIMATYFGAIIKILVSEILMPPLGLLIAGIDFENLKWVLKAGQKATEINGITIPAVPEVAIEYGLFINALVTFVLVAFSVFLFVKLYNQASQRNKPVPPAPPAKPTPEALLLTEIRDLLKDKNQ